MHPGWGNLVAIDWNDLPVGRNLTAKFLKNVKSPPQIPFSWGQRWGEFCLSGRHESVDRKRTKNRPIRPNIPLTKGKERKNSKFSHSGSKMFSIDWQYLSLGYLEKNDFFFSQN